MLVELDDPTRQRLRQLQKTESAKRDYVKITTLLMLDQGFSPDQTASVLGIDHTTVYRYAQTFRTQGADGLLGDGYRGWWGKLDSHQLSRLRLQLHRQFYTSAKAIGHWLQTTYQIAYHPKSLPRLLRRIGFRPKKTTLVAPKADPDKQRAFVQQLEMKIEQLTDSEVVYFADAVHPQHNTRPAQGWIEAGQCFFIPCNSSRYRLNINAVINPLKPTEVIARQDKTIDSSSTIRLFEQILVANPTKTAIHIYTDSARYYVSQAVKDWVADTPIRLHHLPAYSPNLNPIERLWKFMRKQVIDSTYSADLATFRTRILNFLADLSSYQTDLERLINLRLPIIDGPTLVAV